MRQGYIFFIFLVLLIPFQVSAQEISYDITIELSQDKAHEAVRITVNNTGTVPFEDFSYRLPGDASDIRVFDAAGELSPEISVGEEILISARFRTPIQPDEEKLITIEFDTAELLSANGDSFIFSALFSPPPALTRNFLLKIELPKGMGLAHPVSSAAQTDIAPLPDKTVSDGTKTIFEWDVKEMGEFAVFIRYGKLSPPDYSSVLLDYASLFILAIVLVGLSFFISRKRPRKEAEGFMKEDEQVLIDLIRENEGIVQKRLADYTDFSKAKVSKIVSDLEKRGIVRVEKSGRRNKLFLTEEFKKG